MEFKNWFLEAKENLYERYMESKAEGARLKSFKSWSKDLYNNIKIDQTKAEKLALVIENVLNCSSESALKLAKKIPNIRPYSEDFENEEDLKQTLLYFAKIECITITKKIEVPDDWEMYKPNGNLAIKKKAIRFMNNMENKKDDIVKTTRTAASFLRSFRRMSKTKKYAEADDTAVRESVFVFFEKVCNAVNLDAEKIWYSPKSYPKGS